METIKHRHIGIRGLELHVAEIGSGPVVVFLHGFPEIWYSWRHQMLAVANAGYRALVPDWRGYGLSQHPPQQEWSNASFSDLQEDLLAILDAFDIPKAFLVAKDFGVQPAYHLAVLHPERVLGVIALGVPFLPKTIITNALPEGFYIMRFMILDPLDADIVLPLCVLVQSLMDACAFRGVLEYVVTMVPGRAEADFGRFDVKTVVKRIYILFSGSELQVAGKDQEILDLVEPSAPLPSWFTDEDLTEYAALYEKSGFLYPLHIPYRNVIKKSNMKENPKVEVPVLLIMGEKDYIMKFPGIDDYIRSGKVKEFVTDLEIMFIPEGTHFVQEQFPDKVNELLIDFLKNHV